jgi:hypothetical protein
LGIGLAAEVVEFKQRVDDLAVRCDRHIDGEDRPREDDAGAKIGNDRTAGGNIVSAIVLLLRIGNCPPSAMGALKTC